MPEREAVFEDRLIDDLRYWATTRARLGARALDLVQDVLRDPFTGKGQPEPLRHLGPDLWSRRLDQEHRLVYRVEHTRIVFLSAHGHYE